MGGTCTWACVWGCVWVPAYPNQEEKVRLHFLPFPQEGTHTPFNLTPKAAASRPEVSDRPTLAPAAPHTALGPGSWAGAGGGAVPRLAPGCLPPGSQASRPFDSPLPWRGRPRALQEPGALQRRRRRRYPPGSPRFLHRRSAGCSRGGGGTR